MPTHQRFPDEAIVRMAKFALVVDDWDAIALDHRDSYPVLEFASEELWRECVHHHVDD